MHNTINIPVTVCKGRVYLSHNIVTPREQGAVRNKVGTGCVQQCVTHVIDRIPTLSVRRFFLNCSKGFMDVVNIELFAHVGKGDNRITLTRTYV